MAYSGERLVYCPAVSFDWTRTHLIVVSGAKPNFCGHAVVNAGAYYFHVDGLNDYPRYMTEPGYRRYLRENGKTEVRRQRVLLSSPEGAQRKLEELSAKRWRWLVLPNNCASYVEEIFRAGGSKIASLTNCPVVRWE